MLSWDCSALPSLRSAISVTTYSKLLGARRATDITSVISTARRGGMRPADNRWLARRDEAWSRPEYVYVRKLYGHTTAQNLVYLNILMSTHLRSDPGIPKIGVSGSLATRHCSSSNTELYGLSANASPILNPYSRKRGEELEMDYKSMLFIARRHRKVSCDRGRVSAVGTDLRNG